MLDSIFQNKEVIELLNKVRKNPVYNDKKKKDSINYEKFSGLEQSFFLLFDALFKYRIVIEDENYLNDYVRHLDLLWHKIDNFHDISLGVSKILVKFTCKKLGYKNRVEENRREILEYIYKKYIEEGYLYHGVSSCYKEDIKREGFRPQKYENLYKDFYKIQEEYSSLLNDMDFYHDYVSFTDDFMMACLYATYCPLYFSNLLCPSNTKKAEINSYAKRDYLTTFQSFRKYLKNKEFSDEEIDNISNLCNEEWKLLKQNEAKYEIMLVKRSYFEKDKLQDIYEILCDKETDIAVLASQIMDTKIDNFTWSKDIPSNVISFVEIPYADYIIEKEDTEVEVILPTVRTVSSPEDGKVSVLLLLGTIFILLGVILSVIMLYQ